MSDAETVLRRYFDALNERDYDAVAGAFAEDCEYVSVASGARFSGPASVVHGLREFSEAFPDWRVELGAVISSSTIVAGRVADERHAGRALSRQAGDGLPVPPRRLRGRRGHRRTDHPLPRLLRPHDAARAARPGSRSLVSEVGNATKGDTMAVEHRAHTTWEGDLQSGSGMFTLGSGVTGPQRVTWQARAEDASAGTSPEELIAAALSSCFSMALSGGLARAGTPPQEARDRRRLDVRRRRRDHEVRGDGARRRARRGRGRLPGGRRAGEGELPGVEGAEAATSRSPSTRRWSG